MEGGATRPAHSLFCGSGRGTPPRPPSEPGGAGVDARATGHLTQDPLPTLQPHFGLDIPATYDVED
jgi:hypothetical protein